DQAGIELAVGRGDRLGRLAQIRDVVQRVVEAKDVDPALGRRLDEATDEVRADRPRADEEAAAQCERERRLRARPQRADALPRALYPALARRLEAAAARDLEVGEARGVEDLCESQLLGS